LSGLHAPSAAEIDRIAEWEGMPEYEQEDQLGVKEIVVHFATMEAYHQFAELVQQHLTDKTKSIWYPKAEVIKNSDYRFIGKE
jgi:hypothetical protein